jgi:hypothetical protein
MNDVLYDKWNKKLDNLNNLNTKHKKTALQTNKFYMCIKNVTTKYKLRYLNCDLIMENPIKQYIQDLIIDTINAVKHLDTTIHITLSHKTISQIKNETQETFYTKYC